MPLSLSDLKLACRWSQCLAEQCVEQAAAGGVRSRETRLQSVAQRHQFVYLGNDATLFGRGGQRDCYLSDLPNTQAEEATAGYRQSLHDVSPVGRVQEQQNEIGNHQIEGPASDDVILMNAVVDLAVPFRTSTDLAEASISFDDQDIARFEASTLQFAGSKFKLLDVCEVETTTVNIGYTEIGKRIASWSTRWGLLDSPRDVKGVNNASRGPSLWQREWQLRSLACFPSCRPRNS